MSDRPVDPYVSHRFAVDLGDDRPPLGFTEVTGLTVRLGSRPEDRGRRTQAWPGRRERTGRRRGVAPDPSDRRPTSPHLHLRRGVTDDRRLWNWLQDWIDGEATPRTVRVFLLDEAGDRARGWRCRAATPVRWTGPALAADRPGVATEALAVAHEGIDAVDGRG